MADTSGSPRSWRLGENLAAVAPPAVGIWLVTRVAQFGFAYVAAAFRSSARPSFSQLVTQWFQWDGKWYIAIASQGYDNSQIVGPVFCPCRPEEAAAFFPLYPILIRAVSVLIPGDLSTMLAALIVANLAALIGFIALAMLVVHETSDVRTGTRAMLVLAAFPAAFFLTAPFTEPLFFALAAISLLSARRGQWLAAGVAAYFATLARPTGLVLALPLLWEYARQQRWWRRSQESGSQLGLRSLSALRGVAVAVSAPLGYASFAAFLGARFGDPLLYSYVETHFKDRHLTAPWTMLARLIGNFQHTSADWQVQILVDLGAVLILGAVVLVAARRVAVMLTLYQIGLCAFAVALPDRGFFGGDIIPGAARYMTASIPAFMVVADWSRNRPWLEALLFSGGFLLQGALLARFLSGVFVG